MGTALAPAADPAPTPALGPPVSTATAELRRCRLELDRLEVRVRALQTENIVLKEAVHGFGDGQDVRPIGTGLVRLLAEGDLEAEECKVVSRFSGPGICHGGFGIVSQGRLRDFAAPVAVRVAFSAPASTWHEAFLREVQVHGGGRTLSKHLVPLLAVCPARLALVYPWAEHGSLQDLLQAAPPSPGQGLLCVLGAARGLQALHRFGLVHGDIRSSRILLFSQGENLDFEAKLGGFGRVQQDAPRDPHDRRWLAALPAAQPYLDPCALLAGRLSSASDLFSLGVVLLEVLLGRSAASSLGREDDPEAMHTRALRPQHLWLRFRRALSRHQGGRESSAADVVKEMLPMQQWREDVLIESASLVAKLLEVQAPPSTGATVALGQTIVHAAPRPQEAEFPSRPSAQDTTDMLEAIAAVQATPPAAANRERNCVVCMDAQVEARLRPCGHACLCGSCASLFVAQRHKCPICRGVAQSYDVGLFQSTFAY